MTQFVHLHIHSEYSLKDSIVRIKPLISTLAEQGMPAVALNDHSNMFALVKFYRAAMAAGIKPLVSVDCLIRDPDHQHFYPLTLFALNNDGYMNLSRLISEAYLKGQSNGEALIEYRWLQQWKDGILALSGGMDGEIGQWILKGDKEKAIKITKRMMSLFPDAFYLELCRVAKPQEEFYIHTALDIAEETGCPVVATNDVRFMDADDFEAHEARTCIFEGRVLADPNRPKNYTPQQYLRTEQEMLDLFSDIPSALENTVEIAKRCNVSLRLGQPFLPDYPIPQGMTTDEYFIKISKEGLEERLQLLFGDLDEISFNEKRKAYDERLKTELDTICQMGFPGYFLIVADFIRWAKENDVPVGPGRGSGAGSLVAYAMKITDLDPLEYDLLFERFLNPERVSLPDFDIDFCTQGRDRVIEYVSQFYGSDKVSQIITYGTMAAKGVIRDIGRVLSHPYNLVDGIARLVPPDLGMTLEKALQESDELKKRYDEQEKVKQLIDLARKVEGIARNTGKHAGGVVIAPSVLTDFTPLYCEEDGSSLVTQFDKDDVEAAGLVKFDFLGLKTLTVIDKAKKLADKHFRTQQEGPIILEKIPLDDKGVFNKIMKNAETTAVFQLESQGMKELIAKLKPDCFEDIVALVALYRPGPLGSGMVDDFIQRKHGAEIAYPHPDLKGCLEPTYGVILYQEQVMQIAQILAGYTLGEADMLRRAMGKKKPEVMEQQRIRFNEGAKKNNIDEDTATYIFDLMEKFAGYGFNKSHSAAYALLSYQTAWLKVHYPAAFMCSVLSTDMDHTDKIVTLINDCRDMKLDIAVPNINTSKYEFGVKDSKTIIYGLGAIKGVGQAAIDAIVAEREQNGAFTSLDDFCKRIDSFKVNKRTIEALIKAGALDEIGENRATMIKRLPKSVQIAEQHSKNQSSGQEDLFGSLFEPEAIDSDVHHEPAIKEWDDLLKLRYEKDTLGLYLSGHPIESYLTEIKQFTQGNIQKQSAFFEAHHKKSRKGVETRVAGLLIDYRVKKTRFGKMVIATLDDRSARLDVILRAGDYEKFQDKLVRDHLLIVDGKMLYDDFNGGVKVNANQLYSINDIRQMQLNRLELTLNTQKKNENHVKSLLNILQPFTEGQCSVIINAQSNHAQGKLILGKQWMVKPDEQLIKQLQDYFGKDNVFLKYRASVA